jgi:uncharacterized protein YuzE
VKVIYDPETDTLDLILNERQIAESDEARAGVIIDYASDGSIVSIEILEASRRVSEPQSLLFELKGKKEPA